jgi:arginyl-tRNA synthetase
MDFKSKVLNILKKGLTELKLDVPEDVLEVPKDEAMGDFALPCFIFAKVLKKSPVEIAQDIGRKLTPDKYITEIKVEGPYINFFTNKTLVAEETLNEIYAKKEEYGISNKTKSAKKIMIEFSSPNTNKPLHLGHLRNCFLGDSISRIYDALGYNVARSCLVNDRGVHICKSMLAYQKWGKDTTPEKSGKKGDHLVGDMYVEFAKHENDALAKEAQEMLQKWEAEDKEVRSLWKKMNSWVLNGFEQTYKKLGIKFDKYYYESDIYKHGKDIVLKGLKNNQLYEKDGAVYAPLEKLKIPDKVLLRSDGTTVYMTQDLHLAVQKFKDYKLDESIYVVGSEQQLHFKQLFAILEKLGYTWAKNCYHLSYGMVYLPEGKMKSREGKVVDADDLIEEVKELAKKEIKKRDNTLSEKELDDRARIISLAALKFFILRIDSLRDMTYDPKESISFEGETGPYVQYVAVRINSIFEKYGKKVPSKIDFTVFEEEDKQLVNKISKYKEVVESAGKSYKPSLICNYLIELCQDFNTYYHKCPVLKESNEELMKARLFLLHNIRQIIINALALLGIETPKRM